MTEAKRQAMQILQDIPDEIVAPVVEILKGLQSLYAKNGNTAANEKNAPCAFGILNEYANPELISIEKEAWGEAVKEKHAIG